ncbi:NapC/NirT family cytochrome c [Blastochloris sulfoviridis]|uniref:Cytochrome c-type protein NapC n=1 Tax=Blastochloris sulfoviridis TaxID=50712 RepID=A0A5M6HLM9_9HYPH|nr:NapC/NirT family cytochrome c [Blastochloris sulfoviridis]KAA5596715.1 cytochrome c-type protein NapC [Blastochloris sulfoviridis]
MLDGIRTKLRDPRFLGGAGLVLGGAVLGATLLIGFDVAVEASNRQEFCVSCHEMKQAVWPEYQTTVHFANASGVQATCADCHVPRAWPAKFVHKIGSINEIYHWALGTIDTPEKFESHRAALAAKVWAEMKANDSAECRHCHNVAAMDRARQHTAARDVHPAALAAGMTCIDCHKGIAHKLPAAPKPTPVSTGPVGTAPVATAPGTAAPAATAPAQKQAQLPAPTPGTTQAPMKATHPPVTDPASCIACHKGVTDQPVRPGQSPDPTKKHPIAIREGVNCMLCHTTPGKLPGQ